MSSVMILSLATGGYHWLYRKNIESHRHYAQKHGYTYSVVDRPQLTRIGMEVVWLKIFLIREALLAGYSWVLFIDADAEIKALTPALESLQRPNKFLYMARGYSGRINSGFMLFRNSIHSRAFINQIIENMNSPIPLEDDVGWGENGHIIHYAKANPYLEILESRWNNNSSEQLDDYIRHYSAGPLRASYKPYFFDVLKFKCIRFISAVYRRLVRLRPDETFEMRCYMERLSQQSF